MMTFPRGLLFCALLLPSLAWPGFLAAQVTVTHLANEGFLLEGGGKKVLVDALFDGIDGYSRPGQGLATRMGGAAPPFDGVHLILATHVHDDHFSPGPVRRHLLANPKALFLSTPQAVAKLNAESDPKVATRAAAVLPPEGEVEIRDVNGVRVEILNLHHGRDRRPAVQNLGFIIHIGGRRVLHVGDTEAGPADFSKLRLAENPVDLALLPAWFLTSSGDWGKAVEEEIRPRAIGAMHLAEESAPPSYFGADRSLPRRVERIRANYPEAEIFTLEMQRRVY